MRHRTGIIALVDRPWTDRWHAEANMLSRLAERFDTVWMDPPHHWRDSLERWRSGVPVFRTLPEADNLRVYSAPAWLPSTHAPRIAWRRLLAARLVAVRRQLLTDGCDRIVLYIWRPRYAAALRLVDHDASVYHVIDEYTYSVADPPTTGRELGLLRDVDQVIVHSPGLLETKGGVNPRTVMIPNGVDFDRFAAPCDEPDDLAAIPHPRIGYCGYVKRQLDWDLLRDLIARHADWSWVFAGRTSPRPELGPILASPDARPNVHFLGTKPKAELARYPQHFDACIMPYSVDGYTRHIFPLKLHEYLASGRPTVGAPIRSLRDFGGAVELADGVEEWSAALERALDPASNTPAAVATRQDVARAYDWDVLAGRVAGVIEEMLERASGAVGLRPGTSAARPAASDLTTGPRPADPRRAAPRQAAEPRRAAGLN